MNHHEHKQEYIMCSAIWFHDGKEYVHKPKNVDLGFVVCGQRHHDCYSVLANLGSALKLTERVRVLIDVMNKETQGFLTSKNRFVDRLEGMKIAIAAGQVPDNDLNRRHPELHSEDIW